MVKGTPSQGKKSGKKNTIYCRRCGSGSYNLNRNKCSSCGYGQTAKMRSFTWQKASKK